MDYLLLYKYLACKEWGTTKSGNFIEPIPRNVSYDELNARVVKTLSKTSIMFSGLFSRSICAA